MRTLSDELRRIIDASGMSRYRIAQESGVLESTLSRFMAGHAMTTDNLDRLAGPLGLRITTGRRRRTTKGR